MLKRTATFLLFSFLLSFGANAQTNMQEGIMKQLQGMDHKALETQILQMQECMSLDKSALESLQKQGTKIDKTIRKYCAEGKRGKAQSYAQSEGKKFMQSPKIKKIQSCSADLTKQLTINMDIVLKSNAANVCDQL